MKRSARAFIDSSSEHRNGNIGSRSKRLDVFNSREIMIGKMLHLARTRKNAMEEPSGKERRGMVRGPRRSLNLGRQAMDHWGWE